MLQLLWHRRKLSQYLLHRRLHRPQKQLHELDKRKILADAKNRTHISQHVARHGFLIKSYFGGMYGWGKS
jgi:hypothetical protein